MPELLKYKALQSSYKQGRYGLPKISPYISYGG